MYKVFEKPFPKMTSRAGLLPPCLNVRRFGAASVMKWTCTRGMWHKGNHEAGNGAGKKLAEWSDED